MCDQESITLTFDVPGDDFTMAGTASSEVKAVLKKMGVPSDVIRKVAIAMYEGEINMVIHGGGGQAAVEIFPDRVEIRLVDQGPGIVDIDQAMEEGYSTAPDSVRNLGFGAGMGLPNMKKYTDYMRVESQVGKGTSVTMGVMLSDPSANG